MKTTLDKANKAYHFELFNNIVNNFSGKDFTTDDLMQEFFGVKNFTPKDVKKVKDPKIKIIKIDPNLQFSNISSAKCDDAKTKRSDVETTNVAGGKKRKKKGMDPDLKNCMFPFKEGKGKKAVMHTECADTGIEDWCATDRKEDCTAEKWAYCKSEK